MNKKLIIIVILIPILAISGCSKKENKQDNKKIEQNIKDEYNEYRVKIKSDMKLDELKEALIKFLVSKDSELIQLTYDEKDIYIVKYRSKSKLLKNGQKLVNDKEDESINNETNSDKVKTYEAVVEVNYGRNELEAELNNKLKNVNGKVIKIEKLNSEGGMNNFKITYKATKNILEEGSNLGEKYDTDSVYEEDGRVVFFTKSSRSLYELKQILKNLEDYNNLFIDSKSELYKNVSDSKNIYKISYEGNKDEHIKINKLFIEYLEDKDIKILNLELPKSDNSDININTETAIKVIKENYKDFNIDLVDVISDSKNEIVIFYKGLKISDNVINKISEKIDEEASKEYDNEFVEEDNKSEVKDPRSQNNCKIKAKDGKVRLYFRTDIADKDEIKNRIDKIKSIIGKEDMELNLFQNKNDKSSFVIEYKDDKAKEDDLRNINEVLIQYLENNNYFLDKVLNDTQLNEYVEKYSEYIVGVFKSYSEIEVKYIITNKKIESNDKEEN